VSLQTLGRGGMGVVTLHQDMIIGGGHFLAWEAFLP